MISPIKKIDTVTGKKSKFVKKAEDVLERTYINKDKTLIDTLIKQPEKRTISSINDLYDKLWNDEANQAIQLLKKWKLKVLNQYGVKYWMQPEKIQKHLGSNNCIAAGVVTCFDKNLSEEDVVNLHIEAMQSITPEQMEIGFKDAQWNVWIIDLGRTIGYNEMWEPLRKVSIKVRSWETQKWLIHIFPIK